MLAGWAVFAKTSVVRGTAPRAHALPKWEEFRSHTPTLSPLLPSPPPLLGQGHILNLTPLDTKDGWKGYSLLPGFGDHQILHHLPLQGQGLGEGEGIRPASLPHRHTTSLGPAHQ